MKQNFESLFTRRNPNYEFLLSRMREAIGVDEVTFEDITATNLRSFKEYMSGRVAANSLKTYFAVLKGAIREMALDGLVKNARCVDVLKSKNEPQQNVSLTNDEVERLWKYYCKLPKDKKHKLTRNVLALFLIEAYTGARGCDVKDFKPENISNNLLTYVSKKTHTLTKVIAHQRLPSLFKDIPDDDIHRMTKNRIIKDAAKKCGIVDIVTIYYHGKQRSEPKYKYLGMHCARRSFITNLIDMNVPISAVSKMAGHGDINMTQRYYSNNKLQIPEEALSFFNS